MTLASGIELTSIAFSIAYLILMMRENIWCWLFGILSSALSIYLFFTAKLYSEAILYFYYVLIGFYGWYLWRKPKDSNGLQLSDWPLWKHGIALVGGVGLSIGLALLFKRFTDAAEPFVDAHTTIFSFLASYLEANKIVSGWIYWIVINGVSIWLYQSRGLEYYSWLMVLYFGMSIYGFYEWRRRYLKNGIGDEG